MKKMIDQSMLLELDKLNVLIIDDNLLVHNVLKESLYNLGIREVRCASSAYYGLKLCEEVHFHIVICAFNVKSDKDGFHLLEELKFKGYVTRTTVLIFLSSDTAESLVNSIIELQPDDFWAKPLAYKTVQSRLITTLKNKQVLFNIYQAFEQREFAKAIYYADRHLKNEVLAPYFPCINRMKGECYLNLFDYQAAEEFYEQLMEHYRFSWVYLGYAKALLKQGRLTDIEQMLEKLIHKPETRFGAHDMMAQYFIDNELYHQAYNEINKAMKLAPRNIDRNKKVWDLARLNHDYKGQFIATRNIAHYAKNSIHESPELLLNVIRSGIDYACATPDETSRVLDQVERYIKQLEHDYDLTEFKQQLIVVKARLHKAREEERHARALVENHLSFKPTPSVEDNLDKVKVLHELGMREDAANLLKAVKNQINGDSLTSQVISKYIEQEAHEREDIHFTVKQLHKMAIEHFQKDRLAPAFDTVEQALALNPNNVKLLISRLKILINMKMQAEATTAQITIAEQTVAELKNRTLDDKAAVVVQELIDKWQGLHSQADDMSAES